MCTLTWQTHTQGYRLLFTRDELRARSPGRSPSVRFARGIAYVSPTDTERGGTWIGVNELGVTHCIVNTYGGPIARGLRDHLVGLAPSQEPRPARHSNGIRPSRGALVRHLQYCGSPEEAARALAEWPTDEVPDFCLIQFAPGNDPTAFLKENGVLYRASGILPPVTTSGRRTEQVERFRFGRFDSMVGDRLSEPTASPQTVRRTLARFHEYRHRPDPALGVRMARDDGRSVSLTAVEVVAEFVSMGYRRIPEHGAMRALRVWQPAVSLRKRSGHARALPPRSDSGPDQTSHGERPSRAEGVFDVRSLFAERAPRLTRRLPPGTFAVLEHVLHVRLINELLPRVAHMGAAEFCEHILERLDIRLRVEGLAHLDGTEDRPPVFCSNHPGGAVEGLALIALIEQRYGSVLLPANEILGRIRPLEPAIVPIDRYRGNAAVTRRYAEAFASAAPVLVFPAGRTARVRAGRVREFPWSKSFLTYARRYARPVCPVHVSGRNSARFNTIYRIRRALGIDLNIEMLLLVDELLRCRGTTRTVRFGAVCEPSEVRGSDDWRRADSLRREVE